MLTSTDVDNVHLLQDAIGRFESGVAVRRFRIEQPSPEPSYSELEDQELLLGHKLPRSYRYFLHEVNKSPSGMGKLFSATPSTDGDHSISSWKQLLWTAKRNPLPSYLVNFCTPGDDVFYCFDTRFADRPGHEFPIVSWDPGKAMDTVELCDSFLHWFYAMTAWLCDSRGKPFITAMVERT